MLSKQAIPNSATSIHDTCVGLICSLRSNQDGVRNLGSFDREASLLAYRELYSMFEVEKYMVSAAKVGLSETPRKRKGKNTNH
jgi:hypothetical protein